MDTRFLRSFVTVAELGAFSRAAERLYISQPALSRQVKSLEDSLGAPLFKRVGHGVVLTTAGAFLLDAARRILRDVDEVQKALKASVPEPRQIVALGVTPVPARFIVPHVVRELLHPDSGMFINVVTGSSSNIGEWLAKGHVDIALMYDFHPRAGYQVRLCAHEPTRLFGRPELVGADAVTAQDIERLPMVLPDPANLFRQNLDRWMGSQGARLSTICDVNDHTALRGCLLEGLGCSVLAADALDADVAAGSLRSVPLVPALERSVSVVLHESNPKLALLARLAERIGNSMEELIAAGTWSARLASEARAG